MAKKKKESQKIKPFKYDDIKIEKKSFDSPEWIEISEQEFIKETDTESFEILKENRRLKTASATYVII